MASAKLIAINDAGTAPLKIKKPGLALNQTITPDKNKISAPTIIANLASNTLYR